MDNNDVLRKLRFAAKLNDKSMLAMVHAAGIPIDKSVLDAWFKREEEPGYARMPDAALCAILDGFIERERGPAKENAQVSSPPTVQHLDNNLILRKLKIAFALKDEDMAAVMACAGSQVSTTELSAFFRRKDQRNYRPCMDQFLRVFLTGLARFLEQKKAHSGASQAQEGKAP